MASKGPPGLMALGGNYPGSGDLSESHVIWGLWSHSGEEVPRPQPAPETQLGTCLYQLPAVKPGHPHQLSETQFLHSHTAP